jgi:hypothetical protein
MDLFKEAGIIDMRDDDHAPQPLAHSPAAAPPNEGLQ